MVRQVSHVYLVLSPGRGRGDSCFYQRSIEEGDGAFGRNPREIQRSQSWDDRCWQHSRRADRSPVARSLEGGSGLCHQRATEDPPNKPWSHIFLFDSLPVAHFFSF